ncbi:MAG: hypothetical protein ACLQLH_03430 [Terracidiphilus sp.]
MSENKVKAGSIVVLANVLGDKTTFQYGLVLSVSDYSSAVEEPEISVAVIPNPANPHLHRGNWQDALQRIAGIPHASHLDVKSGARSTAWLKVAPDAQEIGPLLLAAEEPEDEGDAPEGQTGESASEDGAGSTDQPDLADGDGAGSTEAEGEAATV